jgi:hypothetical protein
VLCGDGVGLVVTGEVGHVSCVIVVVNVGWPVPCASQFEHTWGFVDIILYFCCPFG